MPFLALTINQIADSHLSRPIGLSSMIVPILTLKCFLHSKQIQILRVRTNEYLRDSQRGHSIPSGQRIATMQPSAVSGSEKYLTASISVFGNVSFMVKRLCSRLLYESSI